MKTSNQELINDLIERTKNVMNEAQQFQDLSDAKLNWKANSESWSVLECMEHLNRYGDFYLPEIKQRMTKGKTVTPEAIFKSGLLGNYFATSLLPKAQLNKMKTFSNMNPAGSQLTKAVLDKFIAQQKTMLELLKKARQINLTKTRTAISISKLIKLRLGDTFRVVIYHNQRHIVQANKAIQNQNTSAVNA